MIELLAKAKVYYSIAVGAADPVTKKWFLLWADPTPVLVLVTLYYSFVYFGKKYMQNRKEFNIPSWIMFAYNMGLVFLSIYMFYELITGIYEANYNFACDDYRSPTSKADYKISSALWLYFVSKAIELMDTVFMILRKRFNQVTFLHVFHHSTMLIIWWIVMTWVPNGQCFFGATFNSFIHILMYLYYALALIPSLKDKLWWKKYLTTFQLIQFVLTFFHSLNSYVRNCTYPMWGQYLLLGYMVIMFTLFMNFYIQEYLNKPKRSSASKKPGKLE